MWNKCKNFCGESKRRKRGKLVISFLYVETMGVNGVDTPDPHLFSAETDRFPTVSKCLNALLAFSVFKIALWGLYLQLGEELRWHLYWTSSIGFQSLSGSSSKFCCMFLNVWTIMPNHAPARPLRSSVDSTRLTVPKVSNSVFAEKRFNFIAVKAWNGLPSTIRAAQSVDSFKKLLKSYLF